MCVDKSVQNIEQYSITPYINRLEHDLYPAKLSKIWEFRPQDKLPGICSAKSGPSQDDYVTGETMNDYDKDIIIKPYLNDSRPKHITDANDDKDGRQTNQIILETALVSKYLDNLNISQDSDPQIVGSHVHLHPVLCREENSM